MGVEVLGGNEAVTGDVAVISTDHKYIHEGQAFSASIETTSIAAGGSYEIRFKTPASTVGYVHARPTSISTTANLTKLAFYEGATFSGNGTAVTPLNRNRPTSATTAATLVGKAATSSDTGDFMYAFTVGAGGGPQTRAGGGLPGEADEWVLKADTEYLIVVSNIGSTTATVGYINLFWYEEELSGA